MTPSSVAEFSLEAARSFLQTAVFIDDNIYDQATASPTQVGEIKIKQPKPVIKTEEATSTKPEDKPSGEKIDTLPEARPFRTKDLVGSFAKHGIVCALYEPEPHFATSETSTVFNLCQTADLVILDWDFHEDGVQGDKPKVLIQNLINNSNRETPHQVRLIAIYTNTPTLQSIANSLFQHLSRAGISVEPVNSSPYRLQVDSSRILILGKSGGGTRVEAEREFTIKEADLADRLLQEFAEMSAGILPSCALLGMAAVRQNSRRILGKFSASLDGQFLLRRALIRSSEEAFEQLPELLGDEFKAIIEDAEYCPENLNVFVEKATSTIPVKAHTTPWKIGGVDSHVFVKELWKQHNSNLSKVLSSKKVHESDGNQPSKPAEAMAVMCSVNDKAAHEKFASLLVVRTQYQTKHRDLGFGTIVFNRAGDEYSVCIMPPCDALRLKNETSFLFWRLRKKGKGNPVIVEQPDGQTLNLVFELGKPSTFLWVRSFSPDGNKMLVRATKDSNGRFTFKSSDLELEWTAQLKMAHTQRMANGIGQQLSRVGLTEAEWARMSFGISE